MARVCFTLRVDPNRLDEYRARHAEVWPEMLAALRDAGWRDYTCTSPTTGVPTTGCGCWPRCSTCMTNWPGVA